MQQAFPTQRLLLPPHVTSAARARRFVRDILVRVGAGTVADVGELLTSELVTNAVLHGHGEVDVTVDVSRDADRRRSVRVLVGDAGAGRPVPRHAGPHDTSGRGVQLVEVLAAAWGVAPSGGSGKTVWFELRY